MITMVDMRVGNLDSVRRAFDRVGVDVRISDQPADVERCSALVLPGVGAFGDGIAALRRQGLVEPIRRAATVQNKPLLGICLGMQLLADKSEEHGLHEGLGLISGCVKRLQPGNAGFRVPNMGWCDVVFRDATEPCFSFSDPQAFYFAHSYHLDCSSPSDIAGTIDYDGCQIAAAVQRGNLFGVQFHPEKSQDAGLEVLDRFLQQIQQGSAR